ncbi:MAG: GIY-YIG nuclease family protein [Methylobacter sp.]|uniref:GIY-YIG nuclease family protein n=1 Tax=Methylobacter sp. TaxID=2051955 RepID=UPI0025CF7005|nr:GIY-YIG nuclease family protein [Methylobacter sp.]MCK9623026.1 GIY-YIG nuclease family protein [Methylobacter sp.]
MIFLIYKFTSPLGMSYIGQTGNLKLRIYQHRSKKNCSLFAIAIKQYGWENFTQEILYENLNKEDADIMEAHFIKEHKTLSPKGYNIRPGGNTSPQAEETKKKIRLSNTGLKRSDEARANVSASQQNRSAETRLKMGAVHKGVKYSDERRAIQSKNLTGRPVTEKTRLKQSESAKKRGVSKLTQTKIRLSKETNYAKRIGRPLSIL